MNIWLDVTTTMAWGRPALGIVRVEAETIRYLLAANDDRGRFCRFDQAVGRYIEVSREAVIFMLARLDAGGGVSASPLAQTVIDSEAQLTLSQSDREIPFYVGDVYISLGLDWDQKNLTLIYALKKALKLKIILFCHDIIPILMPEFCVAGVPEKFPEYFVNAAWCADIILCNSLCSKNDLRNYLESVGAPVPALNVIRLGCDLPITVTLPPSPEIAEIIKGEYIIFVSTIEARKNHILLYHVYKKILASGNKDIPKLIFVGMQGWGVEDLINKLQVDIEVRHYIHRLLHVSDNDLSHLYRNCLLTVYPSLYEGWGLPVAESLAYGKFCLASSAASIPEVGGDMIEYISPQDENRWAERLAWYFQHPEKITQRQEIIKRDYRPSTWREAGAAILSFVDSTWESDG